MNFISPQKLRKLGILGMNARNIEYISYYNKRKYFPLVDDKLKTKLVAQKMGMPVPELYSVVETQHHARKLKSLIEDKASFVIKPSQGSGGKGIMVIVQREGKSFYKPSGDSVILDDLQRHTSNILSGLYSLGGRNDVAMIEALIDFDPLLLDYSYEGVPDIRVIVYRGVPLMAMLRCSTHDSDGKANLHQGAVGVGINIINGQCHTAVQKGVVVERHPDTGHVFNDLQLPNWHEILHLAARCYEMTHLGYFGADIVLDRQKGPTILELNARPGLAIQIANQTGLRKRLEAIDDADPQGMDSQQRVDLCLELFGQH